MKKPALLFVLVLFAAGSLTAQETFTPLLTEKTISFVHVDLRNVNLDTVKAEALKQSGQLLKQLNFDNKSAKAVLRECSTELGKLDAIARPVTEAVMTKLGINEIAFIFDTGMIEQNIDGLFVVPWKNKTADDLKFLNDLLTDVPFKDSLYPAGDFLFLSPRNDSAVKEDLNKWYKGLTPAKDCAVQQALKSLKQSDEIKYAFALPSALKKRLTDNGLADDAGMFPPGMPKEVQNLLLFIAKKVEWAAGSVSFAALLSLPEKAGGEKDQEMPLLTVKTPNAADAKQLRLMLEGAIEWGIFAGQIAASQNEGIKVPQLAFEFLKGFLLTLLPDVEEDRLIFRLRKSITTLLSGQHSAAGVAGISAALLLPAGQAAREASRRMQCGNNLKMILIALHNYHDVQNGLPPLYTVDKNGKPLHSWRVLLLPYLEQLELYDKIRLDEPWDSAHNKQFHNAKVPYYRCPDYAGGKDGDCHYSAIAGEAFVPAKKGSNPVHDFSVITDGLSNTLAVVEVKEPFCWMDPTADISLEELQQGINNAKGKAGSSHQGGMNAARFDGSVLFLPQDTPKEILKALGDCDDSTAVDPATFRKR
ncbi:MAG: DUF1559 domain-containing protein [Planctomycetaceae bacterium]|jgi:hypothetical protein|nr:DUF1559 domain-containing protein [Planctomycetaceae bacterium]